MSLGGVNFSKMDTEITIQYPVQVDSTSGEAQTPSWSDLKTCQAERRYLSGRESLLNGQQTGQSPINYIIRIDSARPITLQMRIRERNATSYAYINDVQDWKREGYTFISVNRWDNG